MPDIVRCGLIQCSNPINDESRPVAEICEAGSELVEALLVADSAQAAEDIPRSIGTNGGQQRHQTCSSAEESSLGSTVLPATKARTIRSPTLARARR